MILIHGSNSCGAEMAPLAEAFRPYAPTRSPNLVGHGGRPVPQRFAIRDHAEDLVALMDREGIESNFVTGYSTGGYVALYLARHFPERIRGACALATKYVFDAATVTHWTYLVSVERLLQSARRPVLERIHAPQDWKQIARANFRFFEDLGRDPPLSDRDLASITVPVMVVSSNRDPIVPWKETLALGKLIPGAHVAMFYGSAHPLDAVPVHPVARAISQWTQTVENGP